jgi:hypothetical protein
MAVCTFFWLCGSIIAVFCEWTTGTWSDYNTAQARFGNALVLERGSGVGDMAVALLLEQALTGGRTDPELGARTACRMPAAPGPVRKPNRRWQRCDPEGKLHVSEVHQL